MLVHLFCRAGASEVEKTLTKNIFIGYNLKVRPAAKPEERVVVRVGMVLSSFVGLVRNSILMFVQYCTNVKHRDEVNLGNRTLQQR